MHVWTHLKKESYGKTGIGLYPDGMVEHDGFVGAGAEEARRPRIADNTIVIYCTDNGAETVSWPDGGTTPFHGEKGTTWEGGFRVPLLVRWPGVIKPGTVSTTSSRRKTGCRRSWPLPVSRTSSRNSRKGTRPTARTSRSTPTATTSCLTSRVRPRNRPREGDLLLQPGRRTERHPCPELEDPLRHPAREHRHRHARNSRLAVDCQPARRSV